MRSVFLFASALVLAACGIAPAYPEFADAAYRMEGLTAPPDRGPATHTVIYRDGRDMRVEAVLPDFGAATIVFDDAGAAYLLNPPSRPAAAPAPQALASPDGAADLPPDIAGLASAPGVAVRIEDADAPQALETAWAALGRDNARSAGRCEVAGERGRLWRPRQETSGVERIACITADGIVIKVSENGRALWEATSLQRGRQDDALFGVPAGYRLVDPYRVAEGRDGQALESAPDTQPARQQVAPPRG